MSAAGRQERFDEMVAAALPALVSEAVRGGGRVYRSVMARMELPLLRHALDLCGGNQLKTAKLLGINRNTLRKRLRSMGLLPPARVEGANTSSAARTA